MDMAYVKKTQQQHYKKSPPPIQPTRTKVKGQEWVSSFLMAHQHKKLFSAIQGLYISWDMKLINKKGDGHGYGIC